MANPEFGPQKPFEQPIEAGVDLTGGASVDANPEQGEGSADMPASKSLPEPTIDPLNPRISGEAADRIDDTLGIHGQKRRIRQHQAQSMPGSDHPPRLFRQRPLGQ